ncbi:uncharacterized protein PAC_20140 [Phialocephala subalpina]|uniref:Uncharacterized protein n=1 Tax=Phialocephala subalpina TaxID=576137 RepID=A0A1L7XYY3_9HELO|nr:uncharacterized protein PAC_20140 [Phialocephala subalpina]
MSALPVARKRGEDRWRRVKMGHRCTKQVTSVQLSCAVVITPYLASTIAASFTTLITPHCSKPPSHFIIPLISQQRGETDRLASASDVAFPQTSIHISAITARSARHFLHPTAALMSQPASGIRIQARRAKKLSSRMIASRKAIILRILRSIDPGSASDPQGCYLYMSSNGDHVNFVNSFASRSQSASITQNDANNQNTSLERREGYGSTAHHYPDDDDDDVEDKFHDAPLHDHIPLGQLTPRKNSSSLSEPDNSSERARESAEPKLEASDNTNNAWQIVDVGARGNISKNFKSVAPFRSNPPTEVEHLIDTRDHVPVGGQSPRNGNGSQTGIEIPAKEQGSVQQLRSSKRGQPSMMFGKPLTSGSRHPAASRSVPDEDKEMVRDLVSNVRTPLRISLPSSNIRRQAMSYQRINPPVPSEHEVHDVTAALKAVAKEFVGAKTVEFKSILDGFKKGLEKDFEKFMDDNVRRILERLTTHSQSRCLESSSQSNYLTLTAHQSANSSAAESSSVRVLVINGRRIASNMSQEPRVAPKRSSNIKAHQRDSEEEELYYS